MSGIDILGELVRGRDDFELPPLTPEQQEQITKSLSKIATVWAFDAPVAYGELSPHMPPPTDKLVRL